ncbi:hypothetical protein ESY86_00790 [Subsaximicrobium wynnwilliamsii]|jgi:hypothetical protein|uniref:Cell division protein ZapB n=1 Tax=Subsaximicrobium wynnwilliamsii TaxID=291179 RepID=A0A5C6ZLD8_9FLAO|nr:hypothetical protein [Subsaximicrobium wynnwilliamsii]TXD85115.1 hypothetical protein ESY87_01960 [Subsaximicrobium wynnwilliamsii]TXD91158.1 hypothetical protein ESY86_00790 [Subsaximicrobium wynnwilliamsii]TXE04552.1 hypothetical protein ESY88_03440 [Subsaximicrobium wynnwilliamsii]
MSKIEAIVDSLEHKIGEVLQRQDVLKQANASLTQELVIEKQKNLELQEQIEVWTEKHETLKIANSLLGSDENNRETKLKINTLIRDIDYCIAQLSE